MREGQELEQAEALRRTHMHVTSVSTAGKELQQATISKAQSFRAQKYDMNTALSFGRYGCDAIHHRYGDLGYVRFINLF